MAGGEILHVNFVDHEISASTCWSIVFLHKCIALSYFCYLKKLTTVKALQIKCNNIKKTVHGLKFDDTWQLQ